MKIDYDCDISNEHREDADFEKCHEFHFDVPIDTKPATLEDPEDDNQECYDTLAIEALERILGYRFDEDDWYMFDWRDDQTLWLRYNEPYAARRLPL